MAHVHCNNTNCQIAFDAEATQSSKFSGGMAVRTSEMVRCPVCERTDSQWIYAHEVAPVFEGSPFQQKEQLRKWRNAN
jgi:hypothetical protein